MQACLSTEEAKDTKVSSCCKLETSRLCNETMSRKILPFKTVSKQQKQQSSERLKTASLLERAKEIIKTTIVRLFSRKTTPENNNRALFSNRNSRHQTFHAEGTGYC